ncbi:hypothetical protein Tsubulata_025632 [Turnera subulata]|uniref:Uncharacterized protein n=1 Tax=Turnera subulata TaxID=218843 RepID=A0A9Q0FE34_9ROSI|nr:hypothetical protein Tsubulata_025632 [Turnera subulata]
MGSVAGGLFQQREETRVRRIQANLCWTVNFRDVLCWWFCDGGEWGSAGIRGDRGERGWG